MLLLALDCMAQFKLGYYFVVQNIHHRRYPVVDRERGIVWSHAVFDQCTVNKGVLSDGRPYQFKGFNRPSSILVTEAFLIENGKIGPAVKGATLIGNGPDALTRVKMIGNDLQLDPGIGTCGKDGQGVPVGVGQPSLLLDSLTVGGTAS